jgi:mRNA-degrading endonuclease RelE of RelBE toxin-antitoxin system
MLFIETLVFTEQIKALLPDETYRLLQIAIALRPEAAPVIRGSGRLRKLRWSAPGRGKRGGIRVIYYWAAEWEQIRLLLAYSKNTKDDLSAGELRTLRIMIQEWDMPTRVRDIRH